MEKVSYNAIVAFEHYLKNSKCRYTRNKFDWLHGFDCMIETPEKPYIITRDSDGFAETVFIREEFFDVSNDRPSEIFENISSWRLDFHDKVNNLYILQHENMLKK